MGKEAQNRWEGFLASIPPEKTVGEATAADVAEALLEVSKKLSADLPDECNSDLQSCIPSEDLELNAWFIRLKEYSDAGDVLIPSDSQKRLTVGFWNKTKGVRIETGLLPLRDLTRVVTKKTLRRLSKTHDELKTMIRSRENRIHIASYMRGEPV